MIDLSFLSRDLKSQTDAATDIMSFAKALQNGSENSEIQIQKLLGVALRIAINCEATSACAMHLIKELRGAQRWI